MTKKKKEKTLTRAKARVRIQKTETNPALMDLKRQLRIEASLDRVRKKALSMKKPDDLLSISKALYDELQLLGFDALGNSIINIHNDDNDSILNYDCDKTGPSINHFNYHTHPVIEELVRRMKSGRAAFSEQVLSGKKLKEFFKTFRKSQGEKTDAKLRNAKALYYYFYSLGTGALGISNLEPLRPDQLKILKRFRNVFDLAYRRYADIQKAEAQAREGQIQLALERVRARTMAMQHSNELRDAASVLFQQVKKLGIDAWTCGYSIWDEERKAPTAWLSRGVLQPPFKTPLTENQTLMHFYEAAQRGESLFVEEVSGETLTELYRYLGTLLVSAGISDEIRKPGYSPPTSQVNNVAYFSYGYLLFVTYKPYPEAHDIFKRFARVFEQTYTRFLDLQKAEAQAREAKIEAVLERVRSRTMAMQKSEELTDVAGLLFEQVRALGIKTWTAGFNVWSEDNNSYVDYITSPQGGFIEPYTVYTEKAEALADISNARKSGVEFEVQYVEGEKIKELYLALTKLDEKAFEIMLQDGVRFPSHQYEHFVFGSKVSLMFITYEPVPEAHDIFKRLGKVFEQTYTRFLDLQKAEAQAREAQIETALEKVRSRSLGMHHSEELKEVVATIFEKLKELGLVFDGGAGVKIFSEGSKDSVLWVAVSDTMAVPPSRVNLPYVEDIFLRNAMHIDIWQARENGTHLFNRTYSLEEKNEYFNYVFAHNDNTAVPQSIRDYIMQTQSYTGSEAYEKKTAVVVSSFSGELISEKQFEILKRFSRVFEQAYTRFLDLQRAEAQAREAHIEAALEKVRSRSMGMQKSIELREVVSSLFNQMRKLGFDLKICNILLVDATTLEVDYWLSMDEQEIFPESYHIPYFDHPTYHYQLNAWRDQSPFAEFELSGQIKASWEEYLTTRTPIKTISESIKDMMRKLEKIFLSSVAIKNGLVQTISVDHLSADSITILQRFAKVFEQSYTRFLDLQKAEAQAREAQIEAALERVRARTMAMQKSDELADVAGLMFQQVRELGFTAWTTGFNVWSDDNNTYTDYVTSPLGGFIEPYTIDTTVFPSFKEISDAKKSGQEFYVQYLEGEVLKETYLELSKFGDKGQYVKMREGGFEFPTRQFDHFVFLSNISLMFITYDPVPEAHELFKRFGKVFEQTYTRFLDLQKAEAQAREAQIEAALERVRARTMAMQHSSELGETSFLLAKQVRALGIQTWGCAFSIFDEDQKTSTEWFSNENGYLPTYKTPREGVFLRYYEAAQRGESLHVEEFEGETCVAHYKYLSTLPVLGDILKKYSESGVSIPTYQIDHVAYFKYGYLLFVTYQPIPEAHDIFQRFAKVFEQTYTRFLDLQKAEAQAREAKIEASLERVRGKAMAMHSSADLAATIGIFYRELESFSITPRRCGVGLLDKETRVAELSTMNTTDNGGSIEIVGTLQMQGHPVLESVYDNWILQQEYHPVLRGSEIKEYYQLLRPQISFPEYPNDAVQFGYFFSFPEGAVYAWTEKELTEDELKIYRRFTSVLSLTYKRYKDLRDAESRAKEAVKQATLDRVRAEIASMRTKQDLDRITPLIWNELTILGIPFVRCGVFIMDDKHQLVHTFLSTPEGKAIGAFQLDYETNNLKEAIRHWHDNQVYITHWGEKEFGEMADTLLKQGSIMSLDQYLKPTEGIHLHFLPFLQGMLYVGNTTRLQEDDINLLQSLAAAFSTAYARYEDFNKLEAAKQQVEKTLEHLRQAQQQLVQSEKMASLGELTAGIAHEIQNPLNFVNNFSEVSNELIDEMVEEVKKGNFDEAKIIANDLKQNLEKITHHGKRADGIVKSMLQHSRTSSGQKELTDINVLCDEYLRLSFHGLRAKDKSFNAKFETDFDSTLEKINVIPQDIGRVILNLINNAFYAVTEKKKQSPNGYEPTVSVSTMQRDDKVEIKVADNGNGIPDHIKEKIFQPFFTTKPTGQGTGLGLSLCYDILKAHGGDIKVETAEGQFSEFIVLLSKT